jgi:hypothetical protein
MIFFEVKNKLETSNMRSKLYLSFRLRTETKSHCVYKKYIYIKDWEHKSLGMNEHRFHNEVIQQIKK